MKYLATVSYLGYRYHGFERQPHLKTIQGTIEKELSRICGVKTEIKAAGRTDAGVNAIAQKMTFASREISDLEKFRFSLNRLLPEDIFVKDVKAVEDDFDARHNVVGKSYFYLLSYGERNPLEYMKVTQIERRDFNEDLFKKALMEFVGKHDFKNFTTKPEDKDNFIRVIDSISFEKLEEKKIKIIFKGTHFMTYQIRIMVGTAIKVGLGKLKVSDIKALLDKAPRQIVSFKAPAEGLYLSEVYYE